MKPRIFVSSTCYDLKFVREDLSDFIKEYDFEPVLSENGDIGYTPGQNLDTSCYAAMQTSDMVILIVGSEYGSAASGEVKDKFEEYISITRKEFRTAIDAGIPVFAMIDKKVMTEYGIYEVNIEKIEKKDLEIQFKVVKNLNVFRFIKEIKSGVNIPIQEFEKSSDIKEFIRKQWADMFKNYLVSLKEEKENKKIEGSVNEMKALIQKMDIMLDSVGKNVLTKEDPKAYDDVVNQQEISAYCELIVDSFSLGIRKELDKSDINVRKNLVTNFLQILKEIHKENLWEGFDDVNRGNDMEIFKKFRTVDFYMKSIAIDYYNKAENRYTMLFNENDMNKIVQTIVHSDLFYRLIKN